MVKFQAGRWKWSKSKHYKGFIMSWKKPLLDEPRSSASSSKNAKDKSNNTTMLALHSSKHSDNANGRSCSEKDSGFSDTSSDWKHTDAKDQCNEKQHTENKEELLWNHNEPLKKSNRRNVIVAPATQQLPPFYIIKNLVQPHIVQKNAPLSWSSRARPTVSGANSIILLQPPTPQFPKASGLCKSDVTTKKINTAYLPAKSYQPIAPHPNKKPQDKTTSTGEFFNQSKRVCIESKNSQAGHKVVPSTSLPSSNGAAVPANQPTSSINKTELNKHCIINTRHRRFLNTVQVLKQSGLWDITLRTKELMRQSNATQRDIAQLRQHSDLLCQVASSSYQNPSNHMGAWLSLYKTMAESGSYPGLKDIQAFQVLATRDVSAAKPPSLEREDDREYPDVSDADLTERNSQQARKSREGKSNEETFGEKETTPDSSSDN